MCLFSVSGTRLQRNCKYPNCDHLTRYQKAATVAKILCEQYFVNYGLPAQIHSDQGRDFESKLIQDLLRKFPILKSRMASYHPQKDPQPEPVHDFQC